MSALPPKADIRQCDCDVRFVPIADILRCSEERRCSIASPQATKQHRRHSQHELLVCRRRLTNSFFLKDRCSLSDQISFILASNWRAFILAMRDRDRANKNEIETFVFSVTLNDFPHDMLLLERGCRAVRMPHVAMSFREKLIDVSRRFSKSALSL